MAVVTTNLGVITAYGDAVAAGYTGTKAEWQALMASYATVAEEAEDFANKAAKSATDANTAKSDAETAKQDAINAKNDADTAKSDAITAKNDAQTAKTDAEKAKDDAQNIVDGIQAKSDQIDQNTTEIDAVKNTLSDVKEDITQYNSYNILAEYGTHNTTSNNGVRITWTDKENCQIVTPSATTGYGRFNVIYEPSFLPSYLDIGRTYPIQFTSSDADIRLEVYPYINGTMQSAVIFASNGEYTIPANCNGILIRLWCNNNSKIYNATVRVAMLSAMSNKDLEEAIENVQPIENNYITNHYTNTYNVTATPTITSDTNNYLSASGDTTDRTNDIQTMLASNGVCHLSTGIFYVSGITLGWGQALIGSGKNTELRLLDSVTDGYIVKMGSQSTLKDLSMRGIANSVTVSAAVGTRHGILIEGNADGDNNDIPVKMAIDNVFISRLNGGAIVCTNTGLSKGCYLTATNVQIYNCDAGIDIAYYSEFNHFTNVVADGCYYGCVNNGGNNVFVNCGFSRNKIGMLIDNANSQSPNNSHGSAVGCLFNHSDSNNGIGIKVVNCPNGFVFDGCQIFYSQIYLEDSDGIIISNCNWGSTNCDITVNGGGAILFANNMHQSAPSIIVTNNTNVHFVNCYNRSTGAVVSN